MSMSVHYGGRGPGHIARVQGGGTPLSILGSTLKVWHDNQDLSTMFSDYVGTPASIGTAVALQWDKAKHGFGSEIRSTGVPALAGTATAATYNTSTGVGSVYRVNSSNYSSVDFAFAARPCVIDIENTSASNIQLRSDTTAIVTVLAGTRVTTFVPISGSALRLVPSTDGTSVSFTVHSVKEVLGTPRYQSTAAQRPILGRHPKGGRRNLLTYTEDFSNAAYTKTDATITANAVTAPDGTTTADKMVESSDASPTLHIAARPSLVNVGLPYVVSIYAKAAERTQIAIQLGNVASYFDLSSGTVVSGAGVISAIGDGWYRCSLYTASAVNSTCAFYTAVSGSATYTGNGTSGIYLWGAQLETGSTTTATAYQKVTSTYDCTETGVPDCYFLQADGSDDGMVTPALDLTATDKIGVFTAVRKLSDAARGIPVEFGTGVASCFTINAPATAAANFRFSSAGTIQTDATATGYAAPITCIATGLGDIGADSGILRLNGAQAAVATADQGTGNYGNHVLYFFRRGGTTLPFNGLEYGSFACAGLPSADQIAAAEAYQNNFVGAY